MTCSAALRLTIGSCYASSQHFLSVVRDSRHSQRPEKPRFAFLRTCRSVDSRGAVIFALAWCAVPHKLLSRNTEAVADSGWWRACERRWWWACVVRAEHVELFACEFGKTSFFVFFIFECQGLAGQFGW